MSLAAFVIAHHCGSLLRFQLLRRTVQSLLDQTDPNWVCIICDDDSPYYRDSNLLADTCAIAPDRFHVVPSLSPCGAGANRNRGVRLAASLGAALVLYQDDDDLAHPRRVEITRSIFRNNAPRSLVYSGFVAIDDDDCEIPTGNVRIDMLEVLEALARGPLEGANVFQQMVAQTGFIATLSTVAVQTAEALDFPFPSARASEDSHTWMRMAASGVNFIYAPEIPTRYRILRQPLSDLGANGRDSGFLIEKARNDLDGYEQGVCILLRRGALRPEAVPELTARFLDRLAACVGRQGAGALAARLRSRQMLDDVARRLNLGSAARQRILSNAPPIQFASRDSARRST